MPRSRRFKKRYVALPLLVLGIMAVSMADLNLKQLLPTASRAESFVQDHGTLEVFFCPRDDCENELKEFILSANQSLHCALYELDLPSLQEAVLRQSERIDVKMVTDDEYLYEFNHPFVRPDKWGLMHNKFCVIDGKKVSTGSMNPTENGAHKNNNNLLLIESQVLARNYEDEFHEMWEGTFKKGERVQNPGIQIGSIPVQSYFCPEDSCAERVKEELAKAKESIHFMTFSFTHEGIANILLLKNMENVSVRGVMEARQVTEHSKYAVLSYQIGGDNIIKDKNKNNMHHKVFIIDEETVITGSFNPTAGGDERNDENVIIIKDEGIARRFGEEFERVWMEAIA